MCARQGGSMASGGPLAEPWRTSPMAGRLDWNTGSGLVGVTVPGNWKPNLDICGEKREKDQL